MTDGCPPNCTRRVLARIWSPQLENARDVDIFLPPSYVRSRRRYPVIYMQDGQNLADPERAFAGTWELTRALNNLASRGLETIVVGVPNSGAERLKEYSPFPDHRHGGGRGDAYLAFIERTLKPLVDQRVRTRPEREATGIFGSSMGGLISLYSFFRAPETFGFVGAMSPSLWFGGGAIIDYIRRDGKPPGRIYFDAGTEEGAATLQNAAELAHVLGAKGYVTGESVQFRTVQGGRHEEAHWAERLVPALEFLLSGIPATPTNARARPRRSVSAAGLE
jgi:predicted alpha/beta superfamily hydrolase